MRGGPAAEAEHLLDLATGGELTTKGRWWAWIGKARQLPPNLKTWLIRKIRERISDTAGDYLWRFISKRGEP